MVKRHRKMKVFVFITVYIVGFVLGYFTLNLLANENTKVEPIIVKHITIEHILVIKNHSDSKNIKRYKLTAYCCENYPHICNNGDSTYTATMTTPTPGRTVAVDPTVIPYGSKVIINGHTYIAEDCGGAIKGNRIDVLFTTHEEALQFGIQYADVEIIEPTDSNEKG
jgi:3D (Asp-Asp-Asp) domain-containing protein